MCYLAVLGNDNDAVSDVTHELFTLTLHFSVTAGAFDREIDLLKSLNLHANISQYNGVSITQGTQKKIAYKLQGADRKLVLPSKIYERAVELLKKNADFTFAATLRQEEQNPGTIISFSNGYNR